MSNSSEAAAVTAPPEQWRQVLAAIAAAAAPQPARVVWDRQGPQPRVSMTLDSVADVRRWLEAFGWPAASVETRPQTRYGQPGVLGIARATLCGMPWAMTAWDPATPGGDGERSDAGVPDELEEQPAPLDDLADAAVLESLAWPGDVDNAPEPVPAAACALVTLPPVADPVLEVVDQERPAFTSDLRLVAAAAAEPVVERVLVDAEAAGRRDARWADVAAAVAAGLPAPASVVVSDDGWRLDVAVVDESAVAVWAARFGVEAVPAQRVYARRGVAHRETWVERSHPWAVRVSSTAVSGVVVPRPRRAEPAATTAVPGRELLAVAA